MIEYYIYGTDDKGVTYPTRHGMTTFCLQRVANDYYKEFPAVIHINIDVARYVTQVLIKS